MKVYAKDNSGDPASPINDRLDGLFFLASVVDGSTTGEPRPESQFGSVRLLVPVRALFETAPNLYFADFYCMRSPNYHYVTLVMTRTGSSADAFCRDRLLRLNVYNPKENPFLYDDECRWYVAAASGLTVELLYTENVDVGDLVARAGASIQRGIHPIGKGHTTPGGVPKNPFCTTCNLYPLDDQVGSTFERQPVSVGPSF